LTGLNNNDKIQEIQSDEVVDNEKKEVIDDIDVN
jgi:hypothetical protein